MTNRELLLLDAIHLLNDHTGGPYHARLFAAARLLFPDTVHSLEMWRKEDGLHKSSIDIDYGDDEALIMQRVGELVPTEHPCYQYIAGGGKAPVRLAEFVTHREFRRTELYQVAFSPLEVRHQMSIPLMTETHLGGLTVNRLGRRAFTVEDAALAALLARFVVQTHHNSEVLAEALGRRSEVEARDHLPLRRAGLSRREAEVLHWMAEGKRDKEIAIILGISHRTITDHVHSILTKLGVENRTAAVAFVLRDMPVQSGFRSSARDIDGKG